MSLDQKIDIVPKRGPKWLREIFKEIQDRLQKQRPIPGVGIAVSENADGSQISTKTTPQIGSNILDGGGGGGGGSTVNLYGAFNGAPAVFHLKQSSAPTPVV